MPKFTKGEWVFDEKDHKVVSYELIPHDGSKIWSAKHIAEVLSQRGKRPELLANGRLIAAAPEMYELLKVWTTIGVQPDLREAQEKARELIATIDEKEDFKSCPFCSSDEIYSLFDEGNKNFFVQCDDCKCRTDFCESEKEALEAWNRRPDDNA